MKRFAVFISFFFFLASMAAMAQSGQHKFTNVDVNHGLSHNRITCFFRDSKGFLWIGTFSGLNRFDGQTFKVFRNLTRDTTSLPNNYISKIFETPDGKIGVITAQGLSLYNFTNDHFERNVSSFLKKYNVPGNSVVDVIKERHGNFWFITPSAGLVFYNPNENISVLIQHNANDTTTTASDLIASFAQDAEGNNWIIHQNGVIEKLEVHQKNARVTFRSYVLSKKNKQALFNYKIVADGEGDLWVYNDQQGAYHISTRTHALKHLHKSSRDVRLNANLVNGIVEDNKGKIWIATDHGGINIIDKKDFSVQYILNQEEDEKSLAQNSANTIYKDGEGIIWVGTYKKGVSYYHENIIRFPANKHYPHDTKGLPFGDVNRFVEDDMGNLWIGTNGGGLIYYDRSKETYRQFRHDPNNANSISSDVIVSLCIDHEKKLWIGTFLGGLNSYDGKKFIRYTSDPGNPKSLSGTSVWEIFEDSEQRLWIGLLDGGLELFDRKTQSFSHYKPGDVNSVQSSYIGAIAEDRNGNLYFGTTTGLDVWMRAIGRFVHYESETDNSNSLSNSGILDIMEDSKGRIWIGTHGGLNLFELKKNTFRAFTTADGLPHESVLTILENDSDNIWLSTPNGLSNMIVTAHGDDSVSVTFKNYDEADGLPGRQFNENAAFKTRTGELIFGGANGFTIFKPEQLGVNENLPKVVFTDFQLFQKSIKVGEKVDGKVILKESILETPHITLPPGKNFFSLEFAALSFFHPEKIQYKYKVEGLNGEWLSADSKSRKVTFTSLEPGDYTFYVKAANNEGLWNEDPVQLKITVLPPFWKTRTAFVLYVLVIIGALLVTRKLIQQREKMKFAIEQERQEAMRMHELDMMKIRFFTNVSHEFRTPLTLILTPLEKMMSLTQDVEQQNHFKLIQRNAKRLLNLVNQLLDFRKLEVQEIRFNPSEGDIIQFIKETVYSFSDLSEKKDIKLEFQSSLSSLETIFDQDKLEKILFNLLSNAFKFTPEHGVVTVVLNVEERSEEKWLTIQVRDTGIGIPADKLGKIFDRFFQNDLPKSVVNQGSGIGLSITKEFVKTHGGSISVESELEEGTCFTVKLPVKEVLVHGAHNTPVVETIGKDNHQWSEMEEEIETELIGADHDTTKKPVLLLVEDSEDFRFYLKDNLKLDYSIIEAKDGKEGWKQALATLPDLIVTDVMMPQMNGIDLCRKIKEDQRLSHIPVILLTARTGEEEKLEGIETGADDYITKPFNFEILTSRIRSLIRQREKFHKAFPKQLDVKASELNITSLDEKFIQNAIHCVEKNVTSVNFSVEELGRELGISRAHLYKKILSLTGKSPLEFIRTIRLQHAAQLLEKSQLTVSEVAYQVGFNNPKYFAKYFKDQYNMLPSAYAASKRATR